MNEKQRSTSEFLGAAHYMMPTAFAEDYAARKGNNVEENSELKTVLIQHQEACAAYGGLGLILSYLPGTKTFEKRTTAAWELANVHANLDDEALPSALSLQAISFILGIATFTLIGALSYGALATLIGSALITPLIALSPLLIWGGCFFLAKAFSPHTFSILSPFQREYVTAKTTFAIILEVAAHTTGLFGTYTQNTHIPNLLLIFFNPLRWLTVLATAISQIPLLIIDIGRADEEEIGLIRNIVKTLWHGLSAFIVLGLLGCANIVEAPFRFTTFVFTHITDAWGLTGALFVGLLALAAVAFPFVAASGVLGASLAATFALPMLLVAVNFVMTHSLLCIGIVAAAGFVLSLCVGEALIGQVYARYDDDKLLSNDKIKRDAAGRVQRKSLLSLSIKIAKTAPDVPFSTALSFFFAVMRLVDYVDAICGTDNECHLHRILFATARFVLNPGALLSIIPALIGAVVIGVPTTLSSYFLPDIVTNIIAGTLFFAGCALLSPFIVASAVCDLPFAAISALSSKFTACIEDTKVESGMLVAISAQSNYAEDSCSLWQAIKWVCPCVSAASSPSP